MSGERYVNTGAPFTRADGSRWESGATHIPTVHELRARAYKLKLAPVARGEPRAAAPVEASVPTPPVSAPGEAVPPASPAVPETWHMIMTPQLYLRMYPNGPHAEKARRIVEQETPRG